MNDTSIINQIRILPNDKGTFSTEKEFKDFVVDTMVKRGGRYYFINSMMQCPKDTFILFQYNGKIRATGLLVESHKGECVNELGEKYAGYYQFDVTSLHYLESGLDKENMMKIIPAFIGFNQAKQKVDLSYIDALFVLLSEKDNFYLSISDDINTPMQPEKIEIIEGLKRVTCARCGFLFSKAERCPECGQLVKYC